MSNGGQRLRELLKERGFMFATVAKAIGVPRATMYRWTETAPIDKLIELSKFTRIPIIEVVNCFDPDLQPQTPEASDEN